MDHGSPVEHRRRDKDRKDRKRHDEYVHKRYWYNDLIHHKIDRPPKDQEKRKRLQENERSCRNDFKRSKNSPGDLADKEKIPEDEQVIKTKNEDKNLGNVPHGQKKSKDLLTSKTGGAYIPPAKLKLMQEKITDKSSAAYQRIAWEALKKSIHGSINKVNTSNIAFITEELFEENIIRGRGLLARSIIQAQAASPTFTSIYAALTAVINSKYPIIGELILKRLTNQFIRGFKSNNKPLCISSGSFISHLVNQRVVHEILVLEMLHLLLDKPSDDSVEVAIVLLKECGQKLTEISKAGIFGVFEVLRNILHERNLDKRVQYMIEVMFQIRKDGFKDHVAVLEDLDLIEEKYQIIHLIELKIYDSEDDLNVFEIDNEYVEHEETYKKLQSGISDSDDSDASDEKGSDDGNSGEEVSGDEDIGEKNVILDNTESNLKDLRRKIYLTIASSLSYEECAHKLMKMQLKPGQDRELCHMFLDCCAEMCTYEKFYGLLAGRFCALNRTFVTFNEEMFKETYEMIHRFDKPKTIKNIAKFFAHLLKTDSISWKVLSCIRLNEEDTTSSGRVFIKILFQELSEHMGLTKLNNQIKDVTLHEAFEGLFPRDDDQKTRFAVNFFTTIGLAGLTDELREHLKNRPKVSANLPAAIEEIFRK